jgi:Domain of unknown function (DUF4926)/Domain of unknown function (DUF6883)
MKLPAAERAVIAPAKIRDYLVSTSHPVGRFKAPFFASLGYTSANWRRLERDLLAIAMSGDAERGKDNAIWPKVRDSWYLKWSFREVGESVDRLDDPVWWRCAAVRDCFPGGNHMTYKLLDTVVLDRDLPEHGLRTGDLGALVQVYEPDGLEVEFVTASGKSQALVTLNVKDVRLVQESDLITVRSVA